MKFDLKMLETVAIIGLAIALFAAVMKFALDMP